jgi:hypothetical protein
MYLEVGFGFKYRQVAYMPDRRLMHMRGRISAAVADRDLPVSGKQFDPYLCISATLAGLVPPHTLDQIPFPYAENSGNIVLRQR